MGVQPTYARRRLGQELRRLRTQAELTMEEVADNLAWSRTKVLRGEAGAVKVTRPDLLLLADLYQASHADRERLERLMADSGSYRWWKEFERDVSVTLDEFLSLESQAARIQVANTAIFPGLLQSREYAEAVFAASAQVPDPDRRDLLIELRMRRQRILQDESVTLDAVLGGALLQAELGGPEVLRGQLAHLLALCDHPRVSVQVVPLQATAAVMSGGLVIFDFSESGAESVGYAEHQAGMTMYDSAIDVRRLQRDMDYLKSQALTTSETRKLIATRLET